MAESQSCGPTCVAGGVLGDSVVWSAAMGTGAAGVVLGAIGTGAVIAGTTVGSAGVVGLGLLLVLAGSTGLLADLLLAAPNSSLTLIGANGSAGSGALPAELAESAFGEAADDMPEMVTNGRLPLGSAARA